MSHNESGIKSVNGKALAPTQQQAGNVSVGRDMTSSNESASLETKTSISSVPIELTVVLGDNSMPINQLLKMGRGAVIELTTLENEEVQILANNTLIATGDVVVKGDNIAVEITRIIPRDKN